MTDKATQARPRNCSHAHWGGVLAHALHALRHRGVMEFAWAGCDDDEILSGSGHKTKKMVIKSAGFARQIMRATAAAEKRKLWKQPQNETGRKQGKGCLTGYPVRHKTNE